MKQLKLLLALCLFIVTSTFQSCQKSDPCDNITCYNGGFCANGLCNCPTGYSGSDCSIVLTPSAMVINSITMTSYPMTQTSGAGWDLTDGPDPFITINSGTSANQNDFSSGVASNVTGSSIYYSNGFPVTISNLNINWTIGVWDYDATSANDFMTGLYFIPISQTSGFPSTINLNTGTMAVQLNVTWNF